MSKRKGRVAQQLSDDKLRYLNRRLEQIEGTGCKLCVCGGVLWDIENDGNYACGDYCDKPEEYKP